jgi:hypothetical protein
MGAHQLSREDQDRPSLVEAGEVNGSHCNPVSRSAA